MSDARAIAICYRLLSRMDDQAREAALGWLIARLESDRQKSATKVRGISTPDKAAIRKMMGDATMSLMGLLQTTGAQIARRPVAMRGPMNVDVLVTVKRV